MTRAANTCGPSNLIGRAAQKQMDEGLAQTDQRVASMQ